jgi:AraC-like DNA-binding protein
MEAALRARLKNSRAVDAQIRAAIHWVATHPDGRVEQLSRWLGLSSRQLQRRFTVAVGYGPKLFQSVLRFQRLLHFAGKTCSHRSLARLAADAGYSDQAHMTREVRRFSASPPSALLQSSRSTLALSALVQTPGSADQ